MFLVISYDHSNTSEVRIHACSQLLKDAKDVYEILRTKKKYTPVTPGSLRDMTNDHQALLELVEAPDNFSSIEGHTLYWGYKDEKIKTLETNTVLFNGT